jgi:hypothetical protein
MGDRRECKEGVRNLERLELVPAGEAQDELRGQSEGRVSPEVDPVEPPVGGRKVVAQRAAEVSFERVADGDPPEREEVCGVDVGCPVIEEGFRGQDVLGTVGVSSRPLKVGDSQSQNGDQQEGESLQRA